MNKWQITDIRWANFDDLKLPFWKKWNKENPLPDGFWQRIWEYPYASIHIPKYSKTIDIGGTYPFVLFNNFPYAPTVDNRDLNKIEHKLHRGKWTKEKLIIADAAKTGLKANSYDYAISISAIEEMPNTVAVFKEMIRLAKNRVVVTIDVSEELGVNRDLLRELENFLNIKVPDIPHNVLRSNSEKLLSFNQSPKDQYKHIRVLGIVIDAVKKVKDVGIIIPHWESYSFAKACLEEVLKQKHPQIKQTTYLMDDNSEDGSYEKLKKDFKKESSIKFFKIKRKDHSSVPDVGYVLDEGLKHIDEQFVVMIDADTIPLTEDWIRFPIWLIENNNISSVGLDTGLSSSYIHMDKVQAWWQPDNGYSIKGGKYDNNWFTCINNLYRVMRTATTKVVSENIGFTRGKKSRSNHILNILQQKLKIDKSNERNPYLPAGCDNGVAANHFIDINRMGAKFNIPLTSYIGLTKKDGAFGQNISGLLFHFALSTRALSSIRKEVLNTGKAYQKWINKIDKDGCISKINQKKMIKASQEFKPGGYDNSIPTSWYTDEYKYIQNLIKQYKKDIK